VKLNRPLVVLDLETTGTWVGKDKIVEVGMVKLHPDGRREEYKQRVNPGIPIPPRVSQIIGITDADVKDAPAFSEIAPAVVGFIGEADLGGFNVERFDLILLERELFEAGVKFDWRRRTIYDAQKVYHLHEKRDLTAAYQFYCGKVLEGAHTAMADAEATVEILAAQIDRYGKTEEGIESLRDFDYKRIDDYFDDERKFRWWNGKLYPVFGKYARKYSVEELVEKDPNYLRWLSGTDFPPKVKTMLEGALAGRLPTPPDPAGSG